MNKDEAIKMAINTLCNCGLQIGGQALISPYIHETVYVCKEALEQPTQEPVGVVSWHEGAVMGSIFPSSNMPKDGDKLYTHPHQDGTSPSKWTALTDDEIRHCLYDLDTQDFLQFAHAIEAKLKEKNYG